MPYNTAEKKHAHQTSEKYRALNRIRMKKYRDNHPEYRTWMKAYMKQYLKENPQYTSTYRYRNSPEYRVRAKEYKKRPEVKLRKNTARNFTFRQLRAMVLIAYGGSPPRCACCGEDIEEFLTVGHIKNNGNKDPRVKQGGWEFYRQLYNLGFPEDREFPLRVECWNCNCGKKRTGNCPHEKYALHKFIEV